MLDLENFEKLLFDSWMGIQKIWLAKRFKLLKIAPFKGTVFGLGCLRPEGAVFIFKKSYEGMLLSIVNEARTQFWAIPGLRGGAYWWLNTFLGVVLGRKYT